jgi:serine beta-lactamase-like protein LACTB
MGKIISALLIFCFCNGPTFTQNELTKTQIGGIEKIIRREMSRQNIPGLSIAIGIDDQVVWKCAYGFSDLENFVPATTRTRFRSASVGKPMTATAVIQLREKSELALDDAVQKYCTGFPEKKWPVTIYDLLTQQSGIRYYRENEVSNVMHYSDILQPLNIFREDSLLFKPGSDFQYTSFNYNLLGCVIQGASGMEYGQYMQENVFGPAGMVNTGIDDTHLIIKNRARGYIYDGESGQLRNADLHDPSDRVPAGGFLTTPEDLINFVIALTNGKLVTRKAFEEMIAHPRLSDGSLSLYGMGWGLYEPDDKYYGFTEVMHGGGTPGVSNRLTMYLSGEKNIFIAIMTNLQGMENRGNISAEIARILFGIEAPAEEEEERIKDAARAFSAAYVREDLDVMMQYYTEDAAIFPTQGDILDTREAIAAYWTVPEGTDILHHASMPEDIRITGNTAYDYGYYEGRLRRNGEETGFEGKYVIVWEKGEDGQWRMKLDIWNRR